jgi:hypothetical protein
MFKSRFYDRMAIQSSSSWSSSQMRRAWRERRAGAGRLLRAAASLVLIGVVLAGCSPTYNWRIVTDESDGYAIDLPAKPTLDERPINLAGASMPMHMRAAHVAGAVFAVGTIVLPSDDPQLQRAVLDDLRTGLARNLGAAADARPVQVPLTEGGEVPGLEIVVSGAVGAERAHKVLHAWIAARGRRVYQVVIAADKAPPREQSDQFFESFKLY